MRAVGQAQNGELPLPICSGLLQSEALFGLHSCSPTPRSYSDSEFGFPSRPALQADSVPLSRFRSGRHALSYGSLVVPERSLIREIFGVLSELRS